MKTYEEDYEFLDKLFEKHKSSMDCFHKVAVEFGRAKYSELKNKSIKVADIVDIFTIVYDYTKSKTSKEMKEWFEEYKTFLE